MANPVRSIRQTQIQNHGKLGRRVEIGSTAHATLNAAGMEVKFNVPTVEVLIGIGKDHTASLLMDEDAWKALKKGQKINVTSLKQFTKKFL